MKTPDSKKPKNENQGPVFQASQHYQSELKTIERSWQTFQSLTKKQERAFQQMLAHYDELEKEIEKLESREESILRRMAPQERKPETKDLLGSLQSQKLHDLTLEQVAHWRKKLSETRKQTSPRLPYILRILEIKRKHPSLSAAAIYSRLYPGLKRRHRNSADKRMQEMREIQRIIDWHAK